MAKGKSTVQLGSGLIYVIEDWRGEQRIRSRSAAVEALVRKGLQLAAVESLGFKIEDAPLGDAERGAIRTVLTALGMEPQTP